MAEYLTPTEQILVEYLRIQSDLDGLISKFNKVSDIKDVPQYIKEIGNKISVYSGSLAVLDDETAGAIAEPALNHERTLYEEAVKHSDFIANFYNRMINAINKGAVATREDWMRFADKAFLELDKIYKTYSTIEDDATRWTGGRIILSTADKLCIDKLKRGLGGVRELSNLSRRLGVVRNVIGRKIRDMNDLQNRIVLCYGAYEQACQNANINAVPLEINHELFTYLKDANGTIGAAYDLDVNPPLAPPAPAHP